MNECNGRKQIAKDGEEKRAIEQLQKVLESKREHLTEQIRRAELAIHKCVRAEEIADNHRRQLDSLKNSNTELATLQQQVSVRLRSLNNLV